ncbi:UNVERIFIED_CONTAM: hypothetical protein K2H54_039919 [Gekko kuhli]
MLRILPISLPPKPCRHRLLGGPWIRLQPLAGAKGTWWPLPLFQGAARAANLVALEALGRLRPRQRPERSLSLREEKEPRVWLCHCSSWLALCRADGGLVS